MIAEFFNLSLIYFICSINPAVILSSFYSIKITDKGSKNPGATNVVRVLGLKAGIFVFLFDFLKPIAAYYLVSTYFSYGQITNWFWPLVAVIGHCYSPFLRMKGGKGVATYLGALLVINKITFLAAIIAWGSTFALWKTSWKSSITACLVSVMITPLESILKLLAPAMVVILRHKDNFDRSKKI